MRGMTPLSVLDLSPVVQGGGPGQSLRASRELAQAAERLGFRRYWLAEHHNMTGIASAATAVALAYAGEGTSTIRLGAGGSARRMICSSSPARRSRMNAPNTPSA